MPRAVVWGTVHAGRVHTSLYIAAPPHRPPYIGLHPNQVLAREQALRGNLLCRTSTNIRPFVHDNPTRRSTDHTICAYTTLRRAGFVQPTTRLPARSAFFLTEHYGVRAAHSHRQRPLPHSLQRILHLEEVAVRGEDGDGTVVPCHGCYSGGRRCWRLLKGPGEVVVCVSTRGGQR